MGSRGQRSIKQNLPKAHSLPKDKVFLAESNLPCKSLPKSSNPMINSFLEKHISSFTDSGVEEIKIKDIFTEGDYYHSSELKKIIISSKGMKKITQLVKADFHDIKVIERQCDGPSKEREQVWLEVTAVFPNGTTSTEYGIASKLNVLDEYDKTNLPTIAKKRASARAVLNCDFVQLEDCLAAVELPEGEKHQYGSNEDSIKKSYLELESVYKRLINELCKDLSTSDGLNIWNMNDPQKLFQLTKSGSYLVSYIAQLRIEHLMRRDSQNNTTN